MKLRPSLSSSIVTFQKQHVDILNRAYAASRNRATDRANPSQWEAHDSRSRLRHLERKANLDSTAVYALCFLNGNGVLLPRRVSRRARRKAGPADRDRSHVGRLVLSSCSSPIWCI